MKSLLVSILGDFIIHLLDKLQNITTVFYLAPILSGLRQFLQGRQRIEADGYFQRKSSHRCLPLLPLPGRNERGNKTRTWVLISGGKCDPSTEHL